MTESEGKGRKEKSEGAESRPLRMTLLLQAVKSQWLNLLPVRCHADAQTVRLSLL